MVEQRSQVPYVTGSIPVIILKGRTEGYLYSPLLTFIKIMIDLTNKTVKPIILTEEETIRLKVELEEIFMKISGVGYNTYSLEQVTREHPTVAELYRIL